APPLPPLRSTSLTCRFSGGEGSITAFEALTVGKCGVQWSAVEDRRWEVGACVPRHSSPAARREGLAGGVVITKGQERCLYVFSRQEFTRVSEGMRAASQTPRGHSRVFFAS